MAAAAGSFHSAAVGEDGALFVWGLGDDGRLRTGDTANRLAPTRVAGLPAPVRQVAAGDKHTGIVTEAGDLLMFGLGVDGQLGLGDEDGRTTPTLVARAVFDGEAVLMVACGLCHTAVATEGGGVYTFGEGYFGQLGHGDESNQLAPCHTEAGAGGGVQRRAGRDGGRGRYAHGGAERGGARVHLGQGAAGAAAGGGRAVRGR